MHGQVRAARWRRACCVTTAVTGTAGQEVKDFLHGTWLGHPLHPVLTDVPIGAWTAALALDAMETISGRRELGAGADAAIAVGLVGAVGSALTGVTDWSETDGRARKVGLLHGLLNAGATVLYTTSLVMRRRKKRSAGAGFAMLGYAVSSAAAYLGGRLVYGEQIGVDHTAAQEMPKEFVAVLAEGELGEGEMKKVEAEGVPVLLVRRGGEIHAIAHTCSHLGGPLSEGKLEGDWYSARGTARASRSRTEASSAGRPLSRSPASRCASPTVRSKCALTGTDSRQRRSGRDETKDGCRPEIKFPSYAGAHQECVSGASESVATRPRPPETRIVTPAARSTRFFAKNSPVIVSTGNAGAKTVRGERTATPSVAVRCSTNRKAVCLDSRLRTSPAAIRTSATPSN
ncbi:MAG: Rieske 2Fe-2S domain-containing protein [Acidobacteriota bacterium]|nr:Rieske 2Fe-2S domain-containing protein [Acidobacteriota bacterium]